MQKVISPIVRKLSLLLILIYCPFLIVGQHRMTRSIAKELVSASSYMLKDLFGIQAALERDIDKDLSEFAQKPLETMDYHIAEFEEPSKLGTLDKRISRWDFISLTEWQYYSVDTLWGPYSQAWSHGVSQSVKREFSWGITKGEDGRATAGGGVKIKEVGVEVEASYEKSLKENIGIKKEEIDGINTKCPCPAKKGYKTLILIRYFTKEFSGYLFDGRGGLNVIWRIFTGDYGDAYEFHIHQRKFDGYDCAYIK